MSELSKESEEAMMKWIKKFREQFAARKAKEERFRSSLGIRLKTPPSKPTPDSNESTS